MNDVKTEEEFDLKVSVIQDARKMQAFTGMCGHDSFNKQISKTPLKKLQLLKIRKKVAEAQEVIQPVITGIWERMSLVEKRSGSYTSENLVEYELDKDGNKTNKILKDNRDELAAELKKFADEGETEIKYHKLILKLEESKEITVEDMFLLEDFVEFVE